MCNCSIPEILVSPQFGWTYWIPQTYAIDAVIVDFGNGQLYQSTANGNTTAPAQPGTLWILTTVAELIANVAQGSVLESLGYAPYSLTFAYDQNDGVLTAQGYIATSNIAGSGTNLGNLPPTSPGVYTDWTVWASFAAWQKWQMDNGVYH